MKELTLKDFKRIPLEKFSSYLSYKDQKQEVCLEPCLNGYEAAVYDLNQNLVKPKVCTNIVELKPEDAYAVLHKALSIANAIKNE